MKQFLGCLAVGELEYLNIPYNHDPIFYNSKYIAEIENQTYGSLGFAIYKKQSNTLL